MVLHGCSARRVVLLGLLFLFSSNAFSGVCERRSPVEDPRSRFSFKNRGGIRSGGVCWWHSRFQRAAWSLAEFRPELPKPTTREAVALIHSIAHLSKVVIVPGYADFISFSADYHVEIQRELEQWQLRDGFINQSWFRGITGQNDLSKNPEKLKRIMDRLFRYSGEAKREKFVPWVMLQLAGIESHAALLTGMQKTSDGYILRIVESNRPDENQEWYYRNGDGYLGDSEERMIPYYGFHRDVRKMDRALSKYCRTTATTPAFVPEGLEP